MEPNPTKLNPNKEIKEAVDYIEEIKFQAGVLGGNDYELPALERLIQEVKGGQRPPSEARSIAFKILNGKQQDH